MREIKFRQFCSDEGFEYGMHYVDPFRETLIRDGGWKTMQFTGLKDRNGNEIYEGDILEVDWMDKRYGIHNIGPVSWNEEDAAWSLGEGGAPRRDAKNHMLVVGNIYENPDLLNHPEK